MPNLRELNIISQEAQASTVFDQLFSNILTENYACPSEFIKSNWLKYKNSNTENNNLNGAVFENLLATIFYLERITPLFLQVKVAFVPNVNFDLACYSDEFGPIVFSAKTSLRERYKQADLEAIALKYVHRKAQCYLITLNEKEATSVNKKIKQGDVIGIDEVILADTTEFDNLIQKIKNIKFTAPPKIEVINALRTIT